MHCGKGQILGPAQLLTPKIINGFQDWTYSTGVNALALLAADPGQVLYMAY